MAGDELLFRNSDKFISASNSANLLDCVTQVAIYFLSSNGPDGWRPSFVLVSVGLGEEIKLLAGSSCESGQFGGIKAFASNERSRPIKLS